MKTIGLDPGCPCWLSLLDDEGRLLKLSMPQHVTSKTGNSLLFNDPIKISKIIRSWQVTGPVRIVAEQAAGRSGEGVTSVVRYTSSYWIVRGVAAALEIPFYDVPPNKWKNDLDLAHKSKTASLKRARKLWPEFDVHFKLEQDHNKAEAALIAHWSRSNIDYLEERAKKKLLSNI